MDCFLDARLGSIHHGLGWRTQLRAGDWYSFLTGRYLDA